MTAIIIFCLLSLMLVAGKLLRIAIPFFQKLYLPSSVIGGILGLIVMTIFREHIPANIIGGMKSVPGFLINVIFASLFLGAATPRVKEVISLATPQLCMGQILGWGQYVIGLGLAGFVLTPLFGLPPAFGNLLEIGFEGGHGTVGGMSKAFTDFNWEDGLALGYTVATVGMILGIVIGMMLINWALRRGHISAVRTFEQRDMLERIGIYQEGQRPSAGHQTVLSDSIDSLAFHTALIGLAVMLGYGIQVGLQHLEQLALPECKTRIFTAFPLFPLCMIGGVILQKLATRCKTASLIDHQQMQRLGGASLDYLVVAAVATIQLSVVAANWQALLILVTAGALWSIFQVLFLAPRLFKNAWFECAIAEFGQGLGVTATGLMLLRTVDPENKTTAAASFGYKQLLHEPIMGGGIWTALALTLVFTVGWLPVWIFSCAMLILWYGGALFIVRRNKQARNREML